MANGWTPERQLKHSDAIRLWQPWERSTGPKTTEGKAKVARNPWKDGERSALRRLSSLLRVLDVTTTP